MNYIYSIATLNLNSSNTLAKRNLLKDFILDNDIDIAFLQEVSFEDFSFVYTHNSLVNISTDRKGTAILIRKSFQYSDFILDPSGRIVSVVVNDVNLINIYAHSGNNMKKERDDLFTIALTVQLIKPGTLIGGDFNCILYEEDTKGPQKIFSCGLKHLVELFALKDISKTCKVNKFTFYRGESASRLD